MHRRKIPLLRFIRIVDTFSEQSGVYLSYLIVALMLITFYEVMMRYFFRAPTVWAHESSELLYGVYIMLASGYSFYFGVPSKHIKMDVFYAKFTPRKQAFIELVGFIFVIIFVGVILWQGWILAWQSTLAQEHSISVWAPPIWEVRWSIPIGAFSLLIMVVARAVVWAYTLITGEVVKDADIRGKKEAPEVTVKEVSG